MLTIVEINAKRITPLTQVKAEHAVAACTASDPDSIYKARYNCGAWYVDVYDAETGGLLGTL